MLILDVLVDMLLNGKTRWRRIIWYYFHWRGRRRMSTCNFCIYFKQGEKIWWSHLKEWTGWPRDTGKRANCHCIHFLMLWSLNNGNVLHIKFFTLNSQKNVLIIYSVSNLVLELAGLFEYSLFSILSISLSLLPVSFIWILIIFCLISFTCLEMV